MTEIKHESHDDMIVFNEAAEFSHEELFAAYLAKQLDNDIYESLSSARDKRGTLRLCDTITQDQLTRESVWKDRYVAHYQVGDWHALRHMWE